MCTRMGAVIDFYETMQFEDRSMLGDSLIWIYAENSRFSISHFYKVLTIHDDCFPMEEHLESQDF